MFTNHRAVLPSAQQHKTSFKTRNLNDDFKKSHLAVETRCLHKPLKKPDFYFFALWLKLNQTKLLLILVNQNK